MTILYNEKITSLKLDTGGVGGRGGFLDVIPYKLNKNYLINFKFKLFLIALIFKSIKLSSTFKLERSDISSIVNFCLFSYLYKI